MTYSGRRLDKRTAGSRRGQRARWRVLLGQPVGGCYQVFAGGEPFRQRPDVAFRRRLADPGNCLHGYDRRAAGLDVIADVAELIAAAQPGMKVRARVAGLDHVIEHILHAQAGAQTFGIFLSGHHQAGADRALSRYDLRPRTASLCGRFRQPPAPQFVSSKRRMRIEPSGHDQMKLHHACYLPQ
jgi:hypothetical protein